MNIQLPCSLPALFSLVLFPRASRPHEPADAPVHGSPRPGRTLHQKALFCYYCINVWSLKGVNGSIERKKE
ncbi:hypothetical protein HDV63DRAFT_365182 [Trichoderma sp. SZMC 28014]